MNTTNTNPENNASSTIIRTYSKKELRILYGISRSTFLRWISDCEELKPCKKRKILFPKEVEFVFKTFGVPKKLLK